MVERWIKNLPKNKNFVRRIYIEMPARHLNMILGHAIISKSQQVLIEAILPFPKICITEIGAIFWCLYWHYPWLCSCYCQSRYFYNTFVSLQCHQITFQKNQITTEMSMSSTFENYLHVKVIGACLYEIYFLKEFMYSAEMTKTFSKAISEKK